MVTKPRKIKKILLTQPNYAWFSKRTWQYPPYTLCLLKAALRDSYDVCVFDPNFENLPEEAVHKFLKEYNPDLVGITSISTEYFNVTKQMSSLVKKSLPEATIVMGGVIPTVLIEESMKDLNIDYWVMGEGEESFSRFVEELGKNNPNLSDIGGLAYWRSGKAIINKMSFIEDLDKIPWPDYSNIRGGASKERISISDYGNIRFKYVPGLLARKYPFALTITSRGCPYRCTFCAGRTVSGEKVRFRSAENVLAEIDFLYKKGIKEIIFLDDHFLANRKRAIEIIKGISEKKYDLIWKCVNVTAWLLDEEMLGLMYKSGCDYIAVSIESGNQRVLKDIIKKPIKLEIIPPILKLAKSMGFNIIANFVVGFPGESWEEIRETFAFAEKLDVDIVNFHIATPLPKTELMDICMREQLLPRDYFENISQYSGYGKGLISTKEFTPFELEILRSFEWDRINFSSVGRKESVARLNGITLKELEGWRKNTRRSLGINSFVKNIMFQRSDRKNRR